ncbi:dynein cytoplasmic 1 intermediate chain 2-like protein [Reticulomyxa filosa]|uniref:Dynein cytoplasmic 1 intermediate chain 2-like protein n=1 Tax=Reticulomyxa filosa TaxID=46433 RepID=X6PCA1_RETFI|nr:dynein cytoplasmic 1 intermediate chain 2-like protein [Reticulomyxa filosa]|eukprot:ETO35694.1 dynein cytoplasmic 1 intermediate chain 2-like protein [Reticulomyxa filosa]
MQVTDRDERKKALDEAKKRLETRKREREQLRQLRDQRKQGQTVKPKDYGQTIVAETEQSINRWQKPPEEPVVASPAANAPAAPGRRVQMSEVGNINTQDIAKREKETYEKGVATDAIEIAQDAEIISENAKEEELEAMLREFMSEKIKPWPPKSKQQQQQQGSSASKEKDEHLEQVIDLSVEDDIADNSNAVSETVLTNEAVETLWSSKDFQQSFTIKTRWMERCLGVNDEHSLFWELDEDRGGKDKEDQQESLKLKQEFVISEWNKNANNRRAVCDLDCSNLNPDLFLTSYASNDNLVGSPNGTVAVWNFMLPNKPEYLLESQSMVTVAKFHPINAFIILGATMSGQILAWDVRAKSTPQFRSRSGHSSPVYSLQFLPTHHRKMLPFLTVSNDGKICNWNEEILVEPQSQSTIKTKENRPDEIPTTCFSFPLKDSKAVILGCDEGHLYKCDILLQNKELPVDHKIDEAHFGPITNVEFHPPAKKAGRHMDMLFLTSSYDWTVKLWHLGKNKPSEVALFRDMQDYVYDVKWSPSHPAVFACGDGSGKITLFDLNYDFESPVNEPFQSSPNGSISKICFAKEGKNLLAGDSQGVVRLYDVSSNLHDASEEDFRTFEEAIQRRIPK